MERAVDDHCDRPCPRRPRLQACQRAIKAERVGPRAAALDVERPTRRQIERTGAQHRLASPRAVLVERGLDPGKERIGRKLREQRGRGHVNIARLDPQRARQRIALAQHRNAAGV